MIAPRIARYVLVSGLMLLVGFVAGVMVRAQHDVNATNTRLFDLRPVNGKGGEDISGAYDVVMNWPQRLHSDWDTGRTAGVYAESADRIYVAISGEVPANRYERVWGPQAIPKYVPTIQGIGDGRWEHVVLVYDRNGKVVESWDQWLNTIKGPNRLVISPYDAERHLWLVDQSSNQVFKFTHDGKSLALTVGEKDVPKSEVADRFSVQDMAFLPNGDFIVVGNSRAMRFNKDGKYVSGFGKPGSGPGELSGVHGIVIDKNRRIYIADRGNSRIQVFDESGKPVDEWPHIAAPYCIRLASDGQHIWVSDGYTQRFGKYDLNGKLDTSSTWGTFGVTPGAIWGPHYYDVDPDGNLYVAEDYNARLQKFVPKKDADPAKLVQLSR